MPIVQAGSLNTTALVVPDLYVQVVAPQITLLNGVATDIIGVVGTASWGPVNAPVIAGGYADYARGFGPLTARKHDAGTQLATAVQQGAQNFRVVRVSDGSDMAAAGSGPAGCIAFTARYSGTLGNGISVRVAPGSRPGQWRAIVGAPNAAPEVFDMPGGLSGNDFWQALARAINLGTNDTRRGPSRLVTASPGTGTAAPVAAVYPLSGGTDGANVAAEHLLGVDGLIRSGMYALRGQGCGIAILADCDDSTAWSEQAEFGLSEGVYMMGASPAGSDLQETAANLAAAGVDDYSFKLLFGDWLYWRDPVNGLRLVSPQGFAAGRLANLSPEQSGLNKPIYGVVGSERTGLPAEGGSTTYSRAELDFLIRNGMDVITNPAPAGNIWALRAGHNSSSSNAVEGDNYTRLTNYIAATVNAGMGRYVGRVISLDLCRDVRSTLNAFLNGMVGQGMLPMLPDGSLPFSVVCNLGKGTNNPPERTDLGYFQADVQVQYGAINERFIVNLEGGQTVQVARQSDNGRV